MATNNELKRLVDLTSQFARAVENAGVVTPADQAKILQSIMDLDDDHAEKVAGKTVTLANELALQEGMRKLTGGEPSETFMRKTLEFTEAGLELALIAVPAAKVAAFIPAGLKNEKDAAALEKLGVPKLAALCRM